MEKSEDREMTDKQFLRIADVMVSEYAALIKKGFPEEDKARWEAKMDALPPIARKTIRGLVEISDTLKEALVERKPERHRGRR